MSRTDRLFRLLDALRRLDPPVTAAQLAEETGVSVRSVYRDIETLRAGGADIGGERGFGYTLIEDGMLRPQTFSRIEIEALTLGMAEVQGMGDRPWSRRRKQCWARLPLPCRHWASSICCMRYLACIASKSAMPACPTWR